MTALTQTTESLFIDREGANIPVSRKANMSRSAQPFSELKQGKFRRLFNRHSIIR